MREGYGGGALVLWRVGIFVGILGVVVVVVGAL